MTLPPLPLHREWHVVGRAGEELDPTEMLVLESHLGAAGSGVRFALRDRRQDGQGDTAGAGS